MYRFDTHVHTSEVSACAAVGAEEMCKLYIEAGYDGVCITDHYYNWFFESRTEESWEDGVNRFLLGYRTAKAYGDKHGLTVLLGAEFRFNGSPNDFLVFGLTEEMLYTQPRLYELTTEEFHEFAKKNGLLIFQAHPFRPNITPENPLYLDGVEVLNGNPGHQSRNELALEFAVKNGLLFSGGSDFHHRRDVGTSGILTAGKIQTEQALVTVLQTKAYQVIGV